MPHRISENCNGCRACALVCPVKCISGEVKQQHLIDSFSCIDCGACGRSCNSGAITDQDGSTVARLKRSLWPRPEINWIYCSGCEACVYICPSSSLGLGEEPSGEGRGVVELINAKTCVACGLCAEVCGKGAVVLRSVAAETSSEVAS